MGKKSISQVPIVSIIMPIYNAGVYLRPCIESLLNQTLKNIEIICVLDCPTDGSDFIIQEYAELDNRIVIVKNEHNLHIGFARNEGLKQARGKYIGFVDHDDLCETNMLECLYLQAIRTDADFVGCNFDILYDDGHVKSCMTQRQMSTIGNTFEALILDILKSPSFSNSYNIWNKLYKHSLIENASIQFADTRITACEDRIFNLSAILSSQSKKISFIPEILYHHRYHSNNTGGAPSYWKLSLNYREQLISIIKSFTTNYEHYLQDLYIGDIRATYSHWMNFCIKKHSYSGFWNRLPWNIKNYPNITTHIQKYWSLYSKDLTLPKNIFAFILRVIIRFKRSN